jgi:hypothetical protein
MPKIQIKEYVLRGKGGYRVHVDDIPLSRKPVDIEMAIKQARAMEGAGTLAKANGYAISEEDAQKMIPTLKILTYPDLLNKTTIDEVLDEKGRLLLLYLTRSRTNGHWVCLLKRRGTKVVEYFDPYGGYKPDGESKWLTQSQLREFGQASKHLTYLLQNSPYKVLSNHFHFQKEAGDMNTCGRHCLTRLYFKHLSLPKYVKLVKSTGLDPDDFVTGFTYNLIGK